MPCGRLLYLRLCRRGRDDTVTSVCGGERGGGGRDGRDCAVPSVCNITSVNRRLSKWLIIASDWDLICSLGRSVSPLSSSPHSSCQIQFVWIRMERSLPRNYLSAEALSHSVWRNSPAIFPVFPWTSRYQSALFY